MSFLSRFGAALLRAVTPRPSAPQPSAPPAQPAGVSTLRVPPPQSVTLAYAPEHDGAPDAGEIVWTWVPYEENDGRGKDRPVLVIARQSTDRVYAVRLTSSPRDGDRDYIGVGTGEWDAQRRPSWVDIGELYSVHDRGLRREASALPRKQYALVADALRARHGWRTAK